MAATADEIAAGDLSRRVEHTDPATEAGRLGLAFNSMLTEIEEAFRQRDASEARLRRFAADASPALPTPPTSIRRHPEPRQRPEAGRVGRGCVSSWWHRL